MISWGVNQLVLFLPFLTWTTLLRSCHRWIAFAESTSPATFYKKSHSSYFPRWWCWYPSVSVIRRKGFLQLDVFQNKRLPLPLPSLQWKSLSSCCQTLGRDLNMEAPASEAKCGKKIVSLLFQTWTSDWHSPDSRTERSSFLKQILSFSRNHQSQLHKNCHTSYHFLNVFSTMVHLPTSLPLSLHHFNSELCTCRPLFHLWVQVLPHRSPTPRRSSAAHRQVVIVIIIVHDHDCSSYDSIIKWWSMSNTMMIRVFWHLIPPSSLVFRLIHMASSVQPVKQQWMLPVATIQAIFKLEIMATTTAKLW